MYPIYIHWKAILGRVVVVHRDAELLQVVRALGPAGGFARGLNRRQQERDQNADDCDYDEQLDERKRAVFGSLLTSPRNRRRTAHGSNLPDRFFRLKSWIH